MIQALSPLAVTLAALGLGVANLTPKSASGDDHRANYRGKSLGRKATKPSPVPAARSAPVTRSSPVPSPIAVNPVAPVAAAVPVEIWNLWYTVTLGGSTKHMYFNEKFVKKDGKVQYSYLAYKAEEGYLNEEQLGAFALDRSDLVPLFYNFRSSYRSTETKIDGTVQNQPKGFLLRIRVNKGGSDLPVIQVQLPPRTFFSAMAAPWLSYRIQSMKPGQTVQFFAAIEDHLDSEFKPQGGAFRLESPDAVAKSIPGGGHRLSLSFKGIVSTWWVDRRGALFRMETPELKMVIERTTEELAKKFLDD